MARPDKGVGLLVYKGGSLSSDIFARLFDTRSPPSSHYCACISVFVLHIVYILCARLFMVVYLCTVCLRGRVLSGLSVKYILSSEYLPIFESRAREDARSGWSRWPTGGG